MKTERLYLRQRTKLLLENMLGQSIAEQLAFFGIEDKASLQLQLNKIEKRLSEGQTEWQKWDLIEQNTQKVMGSCSLFNWHAVHERAEIGYLLHERFRGNGYMIEALHAVVDYGFNSMKLNRIEAFMKPDNQGSKRIVEKLGFKQEGLLREHYKFENRIYDSLVFSLLKSEHIK
jgi:ribosomal-protein-alanine N-acetyltransferase